MSKIKSTGDAANPAAACLLIVDDNAQLGASLVTLFQRDGFTVVHVRNGRSALQYLLKQRIDIVITDIFMPNGDGLELLRELYRRQIRPRVVVMTGSEDTAMPDMLHVATLMGAEHTIKKPFDPGKQLQLVRGMVSTPTSINQVLPAIKVG